MRYHSSHYLVPPPFGQCCLIPGVAADMITHVGN